MSYYSIKDLTALLKVEQRTILRLIKQKKLRATKIGREWRIHESWMQEYINKNRNDRD